MDSASVSAALELYARLQRIRNRVRSEDMPSPTSIRITQELANRNWVSNTLVTKTTLDALLAESPRAHLEVLPANHDVGLGDF